MKSLCYLYEKKGIDIKGTKKKTDKKKSNEEKSVFSQPEVQHSIMTGLAANTFKQK